MRIGAPISAAMIMERVVLPRPGAPESSTWSAVAPRARAALQDQVELLADLLLADELAEVLRAQRGLDGLVLAVGAARRPSRSAGASGSSVVGAVSSQFMRVPRGSRSVGCRRTVGAPGGRRAGRRRGQRARFRVCRAAFSSWPTWGVPPAASACGVTAATASSASRVA